MGNGVQEGLIYIWGENAERFICEAAFSLFLAIFSWQDIRRKRIRVNWLYGFGAVGSGLLLIRCMHAVMSLGWNWKQGIEGAAAWLLGLVPGLMLLWAERQMKGGVGQGDGYFFLITGCYLGGWQTLELLMGAVFVSSLAGSIWLLAVLLRGRGNGLWEQMRKKKLPFLPCVIPVWVWMLFSPAG